MNMNTKYHMRFNKEPQKPYSTHSSAKNHIFSTFFREPSPWPRSPSLRRSNSDFMVRTKLTPFSEKKGERASEIPTTAATSFYGSSYRDPRFFFQEFLLLLLSKLPLFLFSPSFFLLPCSTSLSGEIPTIGRLLLLRGRGENGKARDRPKSRKELKAGFHEN